METELGERDQASKEQIQYKQYKIVDYYSSVQAQSGRGLLADGESKVEEVLPLVRGDQPGMSIDHQEERQSVKEEMEPRRRTPGLRRDGEIKVEEVLTLVGEDQTGLSLDLEEGQKVKEETDPKPSHEHNNILAEMMNRRGTPGLNKGKEKTKTKPRGYWRNRADRSRSKPASTQVQTSIRKYSNPKPPAYERPICQGQGNFGSKNKKQQKWRDLGSGKLSGSFNQPVN